MLKAEKSLPGAFCREEGSYLCKMQDHRYSKPGGVANEAARTLILLQKLGLTLVVDETWSVVNEINATIRSGCSDMDIIVNI